MKTPLLALALLALAGAAPAQEVDLKTILGPNNSFNDAFFGVSLTYPAGWQMIGGGRWGPDNRENTFRFQPVWPSEAQPSLYYQGFRPDNPRPANPEAWLRESAAKKAASRVRAFRDYANDEQSFAFRTLAGRPAFSYVATFTSGNIKMAEYNVRIVGEKAYVMFFTIGPRDDVLSLRNDIDRMAESVQVP